MDIVGHSPPKRNLGVRVSRNLSVISLPDDCTIYNGRIVPLSSFIPEKLLSYPNVITSERDKLSTSRIKRLRMRGMND